MTVNNNYPYIPLSLTDTLSYLKRLATSVNLLINGKTNNTGFVTLTADATSTIVSNPLSNVNSVIILQPVSEDAAEHFKDTWPESGDKQFTIHHNSNPSTTRNFEYIIVG